MFNKEELENKKKGYTKELESIKKLYGEDMMHFCRKNFAAILEYENILLNFLIKNFEPNKTLLKDIVSGEYEDEFINYVFNKNVKKLEAAGCCQRSPFDLMDEAGYDLYECQKPEDFYRFDKYYAKGELICTFDYIESRLKNNHVFFAVKKNIAEIKREDFENPERQDLYGTSCMSLQFPKYEKNIVLITNRYNHKVTNPDATFGANPNKIIQGLSQSFKTYLGIKEKAGDQYLEIEGYEQDRYGKFYKFNYVFNGINYLTQNGILEYGSLEKFDKNDYLLFDYFLICNNKKSGLYIKLLDNEIDDSFCDIYKDIEKIDIDIVINADMNEKQKRIIITQKGNKTSTILLNMENKMIGYANNDITEIGDNFLRHAEYLQYVTMKNVKRMGNYCFYNSKHLKQLKIGNVEKIGSNTFHTCMANKIELPALKEIGENSFKNCFNTKTIIVPNVEVFGMDCFSSCNNLTTLDISGAKTFMKNSFLNCQKLKKVVGENVETMSGSNFKNCSCLISAEFNNLKTIDDYCFHNVKALKQINFPKLQTMGKKCFNWCNNVESISAGNLTCVGNASFQNLPHLENIVLNKLERLDGMCFCGLRNLKKVEMNELKIMGECCLRNCDKLESVSLQKLKELGKDCFNEYKKIVKFEAGKLSEESKRLLPKLDFLLNKKNSKKSDNAEK